MALSPDQVMAAANAVAQIANQMKSTQVLASEFSGYNSVTDPGWSAMNHSNHPEWVGEDGYIVGTQLVPGDISNAIGSINVFLAFWSGSAVATSAWGNNIQKISQPLV